MQRKKINSNRNDRVASKVQTLVAEILRDNYAEDPLLSGVSLVGSVAHGGLQYVRLFFVSHDDNIANVQKKLDEETRAIRFELAQKMNQKYVPEIKFMYDDTIERAARLDELLKKIS